MSPSAVSHAVRTVEDGLGLPLFVRTTRSVALTELGKSFMDSIGPALSAIEECAERVRAAKGEVTGLLRLNVPRVALPIAITPVMAEMARRHPALTIEITPDDGLADIVAGGFDAGVRLGEMIAQDMVAVRLTSPFQAIMVAAPSYLEVKGEPRSIADLSDHSCIGFRMVTAGGVYAWDLIDENGANVSLQVRGAALTTDPSTQKTWRSRASASPMSSSPWSELKFARVAYASWFRGRVFGNPPRAPPAQKPERRSFARNDGKGVRSTGRS